MKTNNDIMFDRLILDILEILNEIYFDECGCNEGSLTKNELLAINSKLCRLKELYYCGK